MLNTHAISILHTHATFMLYNVRRYKTGLDKLASTELQVQGMQVCGGAWLCGCECRQTGLNILLGVHVRGGEPYRYVGVGVGVGVGGRVNTTAPFQ